MRTTICLLAAVILWLPVGSVAAQECGDLNGSGGVDIGDLIMVLQYVCGNAEIDTALADFDTRIGVSAADAAAMFFLESREGSRRECNPTEEYSFTPSLADTLYIPYIDGIPPDKTEVYLPVALTFDFGYKACAYWPLLHQAPGSNNTFELTTVHFMEDDLSVIGMSSDPILSDTVVLTGVEIWGPMEANHIWFSLEYQRAAPGEGTIVTEVVDRYDPLRYSVGWSVGGELDLDLFRPVVVAVDVSFPMGDCDCSGALDIADVVCIVEHIFNFGPTCEPYLQPYSVHVLDADCSGSVDIADLVYIIEHMFNDGPPPCDPFAP